MRTIRRRAQPTLLLSLATFLTSVLQGQDLAVLDIPPGLNRTSAGLPVPSDSGSTGPIHDDGETEERVPTANQLMVVCGTGPTLAMTLDILNERGDVVRQHILDPAKGQRHWAIDVDDLHSGRYAARVSCARGAVVNRFRRE